MTPEVERLERLAERLRAVEPYVPPPGAKIRGWNLVLAAVEQSNRARSRVHPIRRLVLASAAAAVLLVAGAVGVSADSLPDSIFYPLKGVLENTRGALTFGVSDQLAFHLDLARTRMAEAQAMFARHRVDLADQALRALDDQLNDAALVIQAEKQTDPAVGAAMVNRLSQAIATHDAQIKQARDRAAQALQTADKPATSNGNGNGSPAASPNGNGQGNGATNSPHPTPKR
ncbi:MAG: hypothetical protein E6I37_10965 [Chloroflexi bacterium]|nr:MAG: hypothetical protein E6I37_10965 [Chloroflexota bacterium]